MKKQLKKVIRQPILFGDAVKLAKMVPMDAAIKLSAYEFEDQITLVHLLSPDVAAKILTELTSINEEVEKQIIDSVSINFLKRIISSLESDDATDLIKSLPKNKVLKLFAVLPQAKVKEIKNLLPYPETTAGSLMRQESVVVLDTDTVQEALVKIRASIRQLGEKFNTVFVINNDKKLVGLINIAHLLFVEETSKISKIVNTKVVSVHDYEDQENIVRIFKKHDYFSVPVVDGENRFQGVITVDDVLDVMEEEATEDILSLSGVIGDETIFDSWYVSVKKRLPWLLINLVNFLIAALVISFFQKSIEQFVLLAVFMPVVAGMAGNAGIQTLGIVVRSIALGHIKAHESQKILLKELTAALVNGIIIGIIVSLVSLYFNFNPLLGMILVFSMVVSLMVAVLSGTLIPLTLRKMNIDPAIASSIFLTAIADITAFITFLGTATLMLNQLV